MPFPIVQFGFFTFFGRLGEPHLASEHDGKREGKDVPVSFLCASRGVLGTGQARCNLLCDTGRGRLGDLCWTLHWRRFLHDGQGDMLLPGQQSTLLETRRIICPGMRVDGGFPVALGMPPLYDAKAPALCWTPSSPDRLGSSTSASQRMLKWRPI